MVYFSQLKIDRSTELWNLFFRETIAGNEQRKYDRTAYGHAGTSEKAGNQDSAPNGKNEGATKYKVVTTEKVKYLKYIPARFEVVEEITYIYSCPKCGKMQRPEKAPALMKGSVATPSLVAGIMNAKYVNGMPLARQEREFARYDLNLSTKMMANWIILCAGRYLQPVYDLMKEEFLRSKYVHGDETRIRVIDEPEQKGTTQNWMWVYLTDENSGSPRMVLFQYERTRGGYHPVEFLGDIFKGYFTCDGYQAYHSLRRGSP